MQGLCPKYFLVQIRLRSVIILIIRERSSCRTVTLLTACLNRSCPSKIWRPISSSEESLVPFFQTFTAPIERVNSLIQTQNAIPRSESERCCATPASRIVSLAGRRRVDLLRVHRGNIYQLFGVGALAHRGLPPFRGFVREVPLAFPALHLSACEGCPGHCDTLTGGTFFYHLAARIFQWYQLLVSRLLNATFLAIGQRQH